MRFAGTRIEGFLGKGPNMGAVAQNAETLGSKERQAVTSLLGNTAAAGVEGAAKAKSAGILADGQKAQAAGEAQGAMFSAIGDIGSSLIGGFGKKTGGTDFTGGGMKFDQTGSRGAYNTFDYNDYGGFTLFGD